MRTFNHVGIILKEKMDGMIYVEPLKVHITDCSKSSSSTSSPILRYPNW